jgi:hypothetical protein
VESVEDDVEERRIGFRALEKQRACRRGDDPTMRKSSRKIGVFEPHAPRCRVALAITRREIDRASRATRSIVDPSSPLVATRARHAVVSGESSCRYGENGRGSGAVYDARALGYFASTRMAEPTTESPPAEPKPAEPSPDKPPSFDGHSTHKETPRARQTANDAATLGPSTSGVPAWLRVRFAKLPERVREWAADPDFSIFFLAFMLVAVALFLRQPSGVGGGFVFDEQEAILANPFVRGKQPWLDAFNRDFWGLLPDRSIGSYRPIPNFLWRALWKLQEWRTKGTTGSPINTPFVWFNLVFHATNAALLATLVRGALKRVGVAWLVGLVFCACAVLTEAISGIVGIADVLGGLSLLLCLASLRLSPWMVPLGVFAATEFGLLSKETAIVNIGLVPLAALMLAPTIDRKNPATWARTLGALGGSIAAFGVYMIIRHKTFHLDLPMEEAHGAIGRMIAKAKHYVGAPNLPVDPFNNPLAEPEATASQRISGALRVYERGVGQVVFPWRLSPDYSLPQEPLPDAAHPWGIEAFFGALLMIGPPLVGCWLWWKSRLARIAQRAGDAELGLLGYALIAWPAAFFPLSNIVKVLPTVRAERFWYVSALATSIAIGILLSMLARLLARRSENLWYAVAGFTLVFLGFQAFKARKHANDFSNDLVFWKSAAEAVPNSAKAHLNYSVMLGARAPEVWGWTTTESQEARLIENEWAARLAPHWDMAFIYVGDTLCQLNRMDEAWDWYVKGFKIGPQNSGLIALALQCMSDHNALLSKESAAEALMTETDMPGSWYAYLARDTIDREKKCRGVDEESEWTFPDQPLEMATEDVVDTVESAEPAPSDSASASASANPNAIASTSGSVSASASGTASASASTSASASAKEPLPPCGVDPKYRPRGLDGDPKGE